MAQAVGLRFGRRNRLPHPTKTAADVADRIHGTVGRFGEFKRHSGQVQERLRGHRFGGVRLEELRHQRQEPVVAHLAPEPIQEEDPFGLFDAETSHGIFGAQFQAAVLEAAGVQRFFQVVLLE